MSNFSLLRLLDSVEQFASALCLSGSAGGWAMGCEAVKKSAMRAGVRIVGGCGDLVPVMVARLPGEFGQGILNPQLLGRNSLMMREYSNQNTTCYTKRPARQAVCAPMGEAAGLVAVALGGGFSEGGRGSSATAAPALHIHQPGEKISALPDSGLVLQKKEGAAGGAAGRVETAGETATFNNNNTRP